MCGLRAALCLAEEMGAGVGRGEVLQRPLPAGAGGEGREVTDGRIRAELLRLAVERGEKTFCPSEVARALAEDWRALMERVREVGAALVEEGRLRCTQRGVVVDARTAKGAIRFSRGSNL